jgi:hypothetical protein
MEYVKTRPIKLRDAGKDEGWLQRQILSDPSILQLGDLTVIQREKRQSAGGRLDFLMYDPEDGIRYEIEIMLGKLDESHIIRTIEYWDLERKRYPTLEHRAVIVAEDITNRFFNVIGLLNRSVPIIAVQMNAFQYNENIFLNFVKILDITEPIEDEEQGNIEQTDRKYWEERSNIKSLTLMDEIIALIKVLSSEVRITYNKNHIAVGTTGTNFCWFHPRKVSHIHFNLKYTGDDKELVLNKLEELGIESRARSNGQEISVMLTEKEFVDAKEFITQIFKESEKRSKD